MEAKDSPPNSTAAAAAPAVASPVDQEFLGRFSSVLHRFTNTGDKVSSALGLLLRSHVHTEPQSIISDLRRSLKLLADMKDVQTTVAYARRCLIMALYKRQKFSQADDIVREWLNLLYPSSSEDKRQSPAISVLERYLVIFQLSNGDRERGKRPQQAILDAEMQQLDEKLNNWIRDTMPGDQLTENLLHPFRQDLKALDDKLLDTLESVCEPGDEELGKAKKKTNIQENLRCTYCAISFATRAELTVHCQSESHQIVIMSDEGRDWTFRPPPRGYSADSYTLCDCFLETSICHFGTQCIEAHGEEELNEWKQRFEYRKMRLERAKEVELYGKSYTETLLEKYINSSTPDKVMNESVAGVELDCPVLNIVISSKVSKENIKFTLKTTKELRAVALLQDAYRNHFSIQRICTGCDGQEEIKLTNEQEWVNSETESTDTVKTHVITASFSTTIYGTFRQSIIFDFGDEPVLVKHICVDVLPVSDMDKLTDMKKDLVLNTSKRWDSSSADIIPFESGFVVTLTSEQKADIEYEKMLMQRYPCPSAMTLQLSQSTISEKRLTRNNYRDRMHELLFVEEIARYETVARFNVTTTIKVTANYMLTPCGLSTTSAKYSNDGELFALLQLREDISEDTSAGRLILNNCTSVNLALAVKDDDSARGDAKRTVYEAVIEDKGKNSIYLKLSPRTVRELNLKSDMKITVDIQFKLNRLSFCEWHRAIDKVADYRLIFPDVLTQPSIPWTPRKQWTDVLEGAKLNAKQKEAVLAITSPQTVPLPPILLIGPFGTGKTFTLALAIKQLISQPEPRILICTHSNSAADLYIKEYLHPWVQDEGLEAARPLRVYYHKRWVTTAHPTVQEYCLIDTTPNLRTFRRPTVEDILKHRIIVVTLSISMELASLDLPKGFFTHIFLDEAAQALECEAIMALSLASEATKIVLAGDHMQMSPELFSEFAKERNLHMSLLERLYDHYPTDFPCKILLCENYRAHDAIIKFTSELFYDQKLIASGKQPRHEKFYPLTFFTTRGEDRLDNNSTTFYNTAEVYEVVERVADLVAQWPSAWGEFAEGSIGIMTPYADQVSRIRMQLRKRKLGKVSVERVLNVQGKQFRAVFLSTVRTRKTCPNNDSKSDKCDGREVDYGFLSNSKLLNTAITRAQSLVAVVGDPIALCTVGRCRKVWERFLECCTENGSLFGITWSLLKAQMDGVEFKKTYVLNPLAPEFVPRANLMRRMMPSASHVYYMGPDHGHSGTGLPGPAMRYGNGNPVRPYTNIDDMLEMYHPGGPSGGRRQRHRSQVTNHQRHPPPHMYPNNDAIHGPAFANNPNPPGVYGHPQKPQSNHLANSVNSFGPPPGGHPQAQIGASAKWGTVPPNINPQLTGTNAWQMTKPGPPTGAHQQVPPLDSHLKMFPPVRPNNPPMPMGGSPWMPPPPPNPRMMNMRPPAPCFEYLGPHAGMSFDGTTPSGYPMGMQNNSMNPMCGMVGPLPQNFPPNGPAKGVPPPAQFNGEMMQRMHLQQHMQMRSPDMMNYNPRPNVPMKQFGFGNHPGMANVILPPNKNIYEMALETKDVQLKWFAHLVEISGWDDAVKFAEMMGQAQSIMEQELAQRRVMQNGPQFPTGDFLSTPMKPNVRAINNQVDMAFDSLMSGTSARPPIRGLFEEQHAHRNPGESLRPDGGIFGATSNAFQMSDKDNGSVPLYRRQPGQSTASSSSVSSVADLFNRNIEDLGTHFDKDPSVGKGGSASGPITYASVLTNNRDMGRREGGDSGDLSFALRMPENFGGKNHSLGDGGKPAAGYYNYF